MNSTPRCKSKIFTKILIWNSNGRKIWSTEVAKKLIEKVDRKIVIESYHAERNRLAQTSLKRIWIRLVPNANHEPFSWVLSGDMNNGLVRYLNRQNQFNRFIIHTHSIKWGNWKTTLRKMDFSSHRLMIKWPGT